MKVPPLTLRREDLPDLSTGERTDKLLRALNAFGDAVTKILNSGISFKENVRAFTKDITFTATGNDTINPISVKNETGTTPNLCFLGRAVEIVNGREEPVSLGNPAWALSGDQVVISSISNVLAAKKYRVTITVVVE